MTERRRGRSLSIAIVAILVVVAAVSGWRRCAGHHGDGGATAAATGGDRDGSGPGGGLGHGKARGGHDDPRDRARGSISGTVKDETGAAIASATVCATWRGADLATEETREPVCTTTDARGGYKLAELIPATYEINAAAPHHTYAHYEDAEHHAELRLAIAEARTGVDIVLDGGGVEVKGVVADINGGPIAGAMVRITADGWNPDGEGGWVHSKDDGTFSVWTKPGDVRVTAVAEGYSTGSKAVAAPGSFVEVLLTPEGVLAGTVVEAGSKQPVAGALVAIEDDWDGGSWDSTRSSARTDDRGRFRITRLKPGRYKPTASGADFYGQPAESVLLALGQTVDNVVIEVHPAITVQGKIVIEGGDGKRSACTHGGAWVQDARQSLTRNAEVDADGVVTIKAMLPGTYTAQIWCEHQLPKDHYDPIVVATRDLKGLEWVVTPGGTLRGHVRTSKGEPVAHAQISTQTTGGDPRGQRAWGWERSDKDGAYEVHGLVPGGYNVSVMSDGYPTPKAPTVVQVPAKGDAIADLTLDVGGTIHGVVVDDGGHGVGGVTVRSHGPRWTWWNGSARTADDGSFTLKGVEAGASRVVAQRGWSDELRKPGSHDDDTQGKKVTVVAGETVEVRLVVESQSGTITGVVVDSKGAAISDAFITSSKESDAAGAAQGGALRESRWGDWDKRPVVTGTDGSFKVSDLAPGSYTLRAFRRGGGEAVAEHVAVGARARLEMKIAGSIAGTVVITGGGEPGLFYVSLQDRKTGFSRSEGFYQTGGAWVLRDLPAGAFLIAVTAAEGRASTEVALADGERKDGVQLALEKLVRVRGRMVELGTTTPVPGLAVMMGPAKGNDGFTFDLNGGEDPDRKFITDGQGRFEVLRAPIGRDLVQAASMDWENAPWGWVRKVVVIKAGEDVVDIGDIEVIKRRLPPRDRGGDLGLDFVEQPPDLEPDQYQFQVSKLEADGPAVASGIKVGDVIVAIDGVDVRGDRAYLAWTLMQVPAGTTLKIGLARGQTVTITAGPPR
jgi:Carboxypeptidase regulatory-like domain/PDZ domain